MANTTVSYYSPDFADQRWYVRDMADFERLKRMQSAVSRIRKTQIWRKESDLRHMRLYGNLPIMGFGLANYARPVTLTGSKVGLNVVKNCSDAFVAKITKDRPKVTFVTSGGDWDLQQRARELEKFVDGQFYELGIYDAYPLVVLDACIFGTGFMKFFIHGTGENARIKCERVFPWEIVIDDQEGLYGEPRSIYQRKWIDRAVLMAAYGTTEALKRKIGQAKRDVDDVDGLGFDSTADQVLVTQGWHLPSFPRSTKDNTDGRYTVMIENGILYDEPYACDHLPFVKYVRQRPPMGYWGIGLSEELAGLQLELNVLMQKVQRSFHLLGVGHWFVEQTSKVNSQKIDNDISVIRYTGKMPQVVAPEPVPQQIFAHIDRIYQRCYEVTGISQLEAQSQKPTGLNSGKAIDSYLDITTERFNVSVRLYQQAYVDSAKLVLELSRIITKDYNPEFDVMAPDKNAAHHVKFKENELQDDEYLLKLFPTNALSDEPAERMAQVQAMASANWIDAQDAKRLLDFPDLERAADIENASYNAVERCISRALKEKKYIGPQPFLGLTQAMRQVQLALVTAWSDGYPDDRLQLLRDWLSDAQELLERAAEAANPPPPAMPGAVPGAMPGTPGGAPLPKSVSLSQKGSLDAGAPQLPAMPPPAGGPPPDQGMPPVAA